MKSGLSALAAVVLWSSLAALATLLPNVPPFLKTGLGLMLGSLIALPLVKFDVRRLRVNWKVLALGVYGLFGYHAALFIALQTAPSVQANLVNYLWPLLIVVLAPFFIPTTKLSLRISLAAVIGFAGAALAVISGGTSGGGFAIGYLFALIAAVVWATYSLGTKVIGDFPTAAVGLFAFLAGGLALLVHFIFESPTDVSPTDWLIILGLGLGPLGAAFYFWDYAIKNGNPQQIGLLSFLTPLLSTALLVMVSGSELSPLLAVSASLILAGAILGRQREQ
jgi:drug/metabolite transporter (DMT)-like permease